jgi:hypothetical protein
LPFARDVPGEYKTVLLHYYGTRPAAKPAQGVRAAVDLLGKTPTSHP